MCVCVYMYIKYHPPRLEKVFSAVKSANAYTWHLEKRGPILSQYFHNFSTSLYLRPILGFTAYGIMAETICDRDSPRFHLLNANLLNV